ncbi:TetR family transcriptional regulator [bacterium]|nr:TetR family transcriptional regulator [bacterium]
MGETPPHTKTGEVNAVRGSDAVRRALIDATACVLAESGPSAVSVREVARTAGVNHGQIHHYFGGKRGLLKAAMHRLASEHLAHATADSKGSPIPRALQLAEDRHYWQAVCRCVMEGDLELAGLEVAEGISVPRRALESLRTHLEISEADLDFKASFAAVAALQLGWVALEDFIMLIADVDASERDAVRDRVKNLIGNWFGPLPPP